MPYAFCQYEVHCREHQVTMVRLTESQTKIEADRAVMAGKGKLIHGRPCRTEIAKAQRQ